LPKNNTGKPGDNWNNWMKLINENKLDIGITVMPQTFVENIRNFLKLQIKICRAVGNKQGVNNSLTKESQRILIFSKNFSLSKEFCFLSKNF
jgi:hypothetical protein